MGVDRTPGTGLQAAAPLSDAELLAFARGQLSEEARAEVERRLDTSPEEGELVAELARIFGDRDEGSGEVRIEDLERELGPEPEPSSGSNEEVARLGRYLVIDEIGRGGMGVVLRAYDPRLQREVALKCIRPHEMTSGTQARLVREAQAMAKLTHPNVVGVYDVDLLEDQFVMAMEYVDGSNLDAWLRQPRTWREVIEVFVQAGRGLAAAHAAGLLHRDFKPANVLVSGRGEVKVTDFGIARSEGHDDEPDSAALSRSMEVEDEVFSEAVPLTEDGEILGTPAYMPPEQLRGVALTPAADQYAYCASLWQALTSRLPFEVAPAGKRDTDALVELKLQGPPRWPVLASSVPRRYVDAVTRGLSVEPAARWLSMEALLDELGSDPPRRRRRLLALGGALAVAAAGIGGVLYHRAFTIDACQREGQAIASTWSPVRADAVADAFHESSVPYAEDTWARAQPQVDAFAEAWAATRTEVCMRGEVEDTLEARPLALARACLDEQRAVLDALVEQWLVPDEVVVERAGAAAWSLPRIEACTDPAELGRLATTDDPQRRLTIFGLRERIADARAVLAAGHYAEARGRAEAVLREASELRDPSLLGAARRVVAETLDAEGRYEEAAAMMETAYADAYAAGDDGEAMRAANALAFSNAVNLAELEQARRWMWLAELSQRRLGIPDDHPDAAAVLSNRGVLHRAAGELDEAVEALVRALEIREATLGRDHPEGATILGNLGSVYVDQGAFDDAERALRRTLEIREATLGSEHPDVGSTLNNLANLLVLRGELQEALLVHQRALAIREAALPPDHPQLAVSLSNLANVYNELGDHEQALDAYQRALAILESTVGPLHPDVASTLSNVGNALHAMGRWQEAREAQERALEIIEQVKGTEHPDYATTLINLGITLERLGDLAGALDAQRRARSILAASLGEEHPYVGTALLNIGSLLHVQGEHEQALAVAERALAVLEPSLGREHLHVGIAVLQVGTELVDLGRPAEALAPLERAIGIFEGMDVAPAELGEARFALARARWELGRDRRAAIGVARQAIEELGEHEAQRRELLASARSWVARRVGELEAATP